MAERLGTGLQNLVQRFDSAWHLKKALRQLRAFFILAADQQNDKVRYHQQYSGKLQIHNFFQRLSMGK